MQILIQVKVKLNLGPDPDPGGKKLNKANKKKFNKSFKNVL